MYVRLAFAVAAHLEPEILVVDEVLAVGDAEFQKKCLLKMDDVSKREGRTVLFVSHNLAAVAELTNRGILIEAGSISVNGSPSDAISAYLSRSAGSAVYARSSKNKCVTPHVSRAQVITSDPNGVHQFGESLEIKFWIVHGEPIVKACFSFQIVNQFQQPAIHAWALYPDVRFANQKGSSVLTCRFPSLRLNIGHFHLRTILSGPPHCEVYERLDGICNFEVVRTGETRLWGWHPEDCAYHEQWNWTVDATANTCRERVILRP
jgi:lipopolysaccharide transport system ATP-binding protein